MIMNDGSATIYFLDTKSLGEVGQVRGVQSKNNIHTSIFDIPCSTFDIQLALIGTEIVTFCSM